MSTAISLHDVTVSFNGKPSITGVSLEVQADELTVLVGCSGSGKSTLLRAVNRLNDEFEGSTTSGKISVLIGGAEVDIYASAVNPEFLRSRVGMVFQTPNVLPISIERNILLPQKLVLGITGKKAQERMEEVLEDVGLLGEVDYRLSQPAATLSGGQQQRLCLARALALDPEILLLDEPTASVDYKSAQLIEQLLLRLAPSLPMVVVSHSLSQTRTLADRVILMREGSIVGTWRKGSAITELDELLTTTF